MVAVVVFSILGLVGAFYAGLAIGLRSQAPEVPIAKESSASLLPVAETFKMPEQFTYDRALMAKSEQDVANIPTKDIPQSAMLAAETARKAPPRKFADEAETAPPDPAGGQQQVAGLPSMVVSMRNQVAQEAETPDEDRAVQLQYSLQIKAFRSEKDAATLTDQLRGNGYEAWVSKTESKDKGTWYRVRIGMFKTAAEAEKYQKIFEAREGMTTLVSTH